MSDQTVTQLSAISALDDDDLLMVVEDGTAKKVTVLELRDILLSKTVVRTGQSMYHVPSVSGTLTTVTTTQDVLRGVPVFLPKGVTIDRITVEVSTGAGSSSVRLGIYETGTDGAPNDLLVDGGNVDTTGSGTKEATVSVVTPYTGWYWLVAVSQGGNPTYYGWSGTNGNVLVVPVFPMSTSAPANNSPSLGIFKNSVSGALPDPFASSASGTTGFMARIAIRIQ